MQPDPSPTFSVQKPMVYGLLLDSFQIKKWQWLCIQKLLSEKNAQLGFVLLNDAPILKSNKYKKYSSNNSLYYLYERSMRKLDMLQLVDISDELKNYEKIRMIPDKIKNANYFSTKDLEYLAAKSPDFLLRFGFGIVKGDILDLPKYGVWSFHHGDMQVLRGGPMGIWEIILGQDHQGAVLQKLTNKLDAGIVLRQAKIALSKHSAKSNINSILEISTNWPAWVCRNIHLNAEKAIPTDTPESNASIYKIPGNTKMMGFFIRQITSNILFHCRQLFTAEDWNIALIDKPIDRLEQSDIASAQWANANQSSSYKADPFYMDLPGAKVLFELFDYHTQKAKIVSLPIKNKRIVGKIKTEIESKHHLSYPYIFSKDNICHLFPESFTSNKQEHYMWREKWIPQDPLIKGENLIDSTLVYKDSIYWLWCSKKDQLNNAGLYLYFSDNLHSTFKEHPMNPVKIDIYSARPGGTPFLKDGKLFRPAQNCSKTYGGSLVLNEIIELTPTSYKEIRIKEFFPDLDSRYNRALHTLSYAGEQTLIDGKRIIFNLPNFLFQLRRKISKLTGK